MKNLTDAQKQYLVKQDIARRVPQKTFADPQQQENWNNAQLDISTQKNNYINDWDAKMNKGVKDASAKFGNDMNVSTKNFITPGEPPPRSLTDKLGFSPGDKYTADPYTYGYNQAINSLITLMTKRKVKQGADEWEQIYKDSYNKTIQEYGNDPEKLYDDGKYLEDKQNTNRTLAEFFYLANTPDSDKYAFDPEIWGHNAALKYMYSVIPRPRKKDWTDYFIDGLTMPFTIAAQIPGLNAIPGVKEAAAVGDVINSIKDKPLF